MGEALLTDTLRQQLEQNGREQAEAKARGDWINFPPVVKIYAPDGMATWLLTELYPADPDVAFGLCDLGLGFPELGDVRLSELAAYRGPAGLPLKQDPDFAADRPIT